MLNVSGMCPPPTDPPKPNPKADDPFADFPAEPATPPEPPKNHDWFTEFPDEKSITRVVRSKTWQRLGENVKDDKR